MLMGWLLPYPILCFYFLLFHFPSHYSSLEPLCIPHDYSALLHFNNSFSLNSSASERCVNNYPKTASWGNGSNCCLWDGVTCDSTSGHVIGLDLSCSWLQGQFHPNSSLFQLSHLRTLNLALNNFVGSSISSQFGDLLTLTHLNLSSSEFGGEIPSRISHLSKLASLDLSHNSFYSFVGFSYLRLEPSTWENLIVNITDLRELVLDNVDMSSIRPSSLSLLINSSSSLVTLSLYYNGLQGNWANIILYLQNLQKLSLSGGGNLKFQLPKSNWSSPLRFLSLSGSAFSGEVPDSLGHLKSLNVLDLSYCQFEGHVPPGFGNLTQLTKLILSSNKFSGEISFLSSLQRLTYFDLHDNNFSGQIPLPILNLEYLTYLDLSGNNFSGRIPASLSNLKHLTVLYLHRNSFNGEIPNVFGKLPKLETLALSNNNIGGQLPSSFSNLTQLVSLDCSSNKLAGPIPDKVCKLPNLVHLDLSDNLLNGTIPNDCFSSLSLHGLNLRKNHLTGPIGPFSTHSLKYCDLSNNKLQGNIPESIFSLVNLTDLYLSANNLSGLVNFHQFSKLQYLYSLDLSNNKFLSIYFDNDADYTIPYLQMLDLSSCNIDSFPRFLGNLQILQSLNLSNNQIQGKIPEWFNKVGNGSLTSLDLSHNNLTSVENLSMRNIWLLDLSFDMLQGNLPMINIWLLDLNFNMFQGNLTIPLFGVEFFSISNNKLSGDISLSLCNASNLEILNLSHNDLIGPIPQCLLALPQLSVLDLQMNNLVGTIPRNFSKSNSLQTLHFNGNQLEGPLPLSLAYCNQLEVLDVGENKIEDTFPNWLESLQELQVLILKANKFRGAITNSKIKRPFPKLRIFDVSNNHFNGSLPTTYIKEFRGMMKVNDGAIGFQ